MTVQAEKRARVLAEEPMRPAGPVKGFTAGTVETIRDLWAHRELLDLLIRRELKARYKDSTLGFFWSLMRPLTMLLIYYVAVGQFLGAARDVEGFAIYIFAGLTAWNLFNELVASGTQSVVSNSGLVKKVYLPREIFPLSTAGSALFNFAIQLLILVLAILVTGAIPSLGDVLYFPLAFAVLLVFGLALALVLSAVNVYLRDVQYLIEIALMVLFWASPIVYPWTAVRDAVGSVATEIYLANPMTLVVLGFQRAFWAEGAGTPVPPDLNLRLWIALAVGALLLWVAQRVFTRLQGNFAQEL